MRVKRRSVLCNELFRYITYYLFVHSIITEQISKNMKRILIITTVLYLSFYTLIYLNN